MSLGKLFENAEMVEGESHLSLEDVAFITCRGGWPKAMNKSCRSVCLQTSEGWRFSGSNWMPEGLIVKLIRNDDMVAQGHPYIYSAEA